MVSPLKTKCQPKTGNSIQDVSGRGKRPSKYKPIEPTKREDVVKYQLETYSKHLPSESALDSIQKGYSVKICFINRADVWVAVKEFDLETGRVYGNLDSSCKLISGLQMGQLVSFTTDYIMEIDDHWS